MDDRSEQKLVLWPEPAHLALGKQAMEAPMSQQEKSTHPVQEYKVWAPCYPWYFGPQRNRQPRWVPALVTKIFGTHSVNVRVVPHGPTWRWHIEQLRPRQGATEDNDPGKLEAPTPGERRTQRNSRRPSDNHYGMENLRRSERIRQRKAGRK